MANEPEFISSNLGALRSAMTLTLHTHHALRVFQGRAPGEGRPAIIGLTGYLAIVNKIKHGAELDDPYSDWWMLQVEDKVEQTRAVLAVLREQVVSVLTCVPSAVSLGDNLNLHPVTLPLFVTTQLGFMAVYLLADFDEIARQFILAHHVALIDRGTLERALNEGAHCMRSLFSMAQPYRYSGAGRNDFAAQNAVARQAVERFGELPKEVLDGTRRSRFAPVFQRTDSPLLFTSLPETDEPDVNPDNNA
ncbi:PFL_4669 family integrating conjugative element protein [Lelliottia amnigena]|uniref:PFL_4669 family integrating conjugative element protein n=1 Tax=Lelliottia amnigena TaxID=61646 RepID=UPI0040563427